MTQEHSLKNLKVLMLLDNPFISDARVEKEAAALLQAGAEVTVLCTTQSGLEESEFRNGYSILRKIRDGYNAPLRKGYQEFLDSCVKLISAYSFDVLHCHDFYMLSIGAAFKKKNPSVKLIYDAHEYLKGWPFYKTSAGLNKWKGKLVWNKLVQKEKKEIHLADDVVTITEEIAQRLKKNNGLNKLPLVVGNHPLKTELNIDPTYFHTKFKLDPNQKIIVHTGTIYHSNEQLADFFTILKNHSGLNLVFIGNRPRFFEVQKIVEADTTLKGLIYFHSYPNNQQEVLQLLASADLGLLHVNDSWEAHKIGFSNRFVEYIMAGLPVVATPQTFTEKFNQQYPCCAFYGEHNPQQLEKALVYILENLDEFKSNAKKASEYLDWNKEAEKLITLFHTYTHD